MLGADVGHAGAGGVDAVAGDEPRHPLGDGEVQIDVAIERFDGQPAAAGKTVLDLGAGQGRQGGKRVVVEKVGAGVTGEILEHRHRGVGLEGAGEGRGFRGVAGAAQKGGELVGGEDFGAGRAPDQAVAAFAAAVEIGAGRLSWSHRFTCGQMAK